MDTAVTLSTVVEDIEIRHVAQALFGTQFVLVNVLINRTIIIVTSYARLYFEARARRPDVDCCGARCK